MPIRAETFFVVLLIPACLAINILFFPEVKTTFFGGESALSHPASPHPVSSGEADAADFYLPERLAVEMPAAERKTSLLPSAPKKEEKEQKAEETKVSEKEKTPAKEKDKGAVSKEPEEKFNFNVSASAPAPPLPVPAAAQPVTANQFKPIVSPSPPLLTPLSATPAVTSMTPIPPAAASKPAPKPAAKPASKPVWETVETVLEKPLRYDPPSR